MARWWDEEAAWPTLLAAAGRRGVRADILEKDYWVTQVLRVLATEYPEDFVFKGGTSLSKAYGCIQRFSEDIDVLILPRGRGRAATSTLMKSIVDRVVEVVDLVPDPSRRSHETGRHLNEYLAYAGRGATGPLEPTVFLEMGVRGEDLPPHQVLPVEPLISSELRNAGLVTEGFADLQPCDVPTLHAGRTLVEKIMMLHSKVTTGVWRTGGRGNEPTTIGRHYHDIHRLLELESVRSWLAGKEGFLEAIRSHEEVNRVWFKIEVPPRPTDGYAESDAFRPDFEGHAELRAYYDRAMEQLFLGPGDPPPWSEVIGVVQGSASLL